MAGEWAATTVHETDEMPVVWQGGEMAAMSEFWSVVVLVGTLAPSTAGMMVVC